MPKQLINIDMEISSGTKGVTKLQTLELPVKHPSPSQHSL